MFDRLGVFVSRHWLLTLIGWAALTALVYFLAPHWDDVTRDGDFAYLPASMKSVVADRLLNDGFPDSLSPSQIIMVVARPDGRLQPADLAVADRLADLYRPSSQPDAAVTPGSPATPDSPAKPEGPVIEVLTHDTPVIGRKLVSAAGPSGQTTLVIVRLRSEFMAVGNKTLVSRIGETMRSIQHEKDFPAGLQLGVTGSAAIGSDMLLAIDESIRSTELTTILLVVLILLVVYRAPVLVIVPIITIIVSLAVALGIVAALARLSDHVSWLNYSIFKTTRIFVVVVLWGAGTDFCLFLIARYREGLDRGQSPAAALAEALGRVGSTVTASAMTTILGLGMMVFCAFGKFRNSGPTIAMCLVVALAASLTLAPALLRGAGRLVFWPFVRRPEQPDGTPGDGNQQSASRNPAQTDEADHTLAAGFWNWFARFILARPEWVLLVGFFLLAPLAYRGLGIEISYDLLSELPANRPSVQGTNLLRGYFPAGQIGPVELLAHRASGGFDEGPALNQHIRELNQFLEQLSYTDSRGETTHPVVKIRSLLEPLGDQPKRLSFHGALMSGIIRGKAKANFLSQTPAYAGKLIRFELAFSFDPFSGESMRFLDYLEQQLAGEAAKPDSPWHGTIFHFGGPTAQIRDLKAVSSADMRLIQILVPIAVLAILMVLLRKPFVCVFLVFSVLFGYFVSIGFTALLFAWLRGPSFVGLDWKVPMYLFVLLIALGEDYNIYLVGRVAEEERRRGFHRGLHFALVRTGGIITSCGVIMAGTFASMITGTLGTVQELGTALAFGVLLDTLVIRTALVPAFLSVWHGIRCRDEQRAVDSPAQ